MPRVLLGIGSNIERDLSIEAGLDALQELLGEMSLSSVYDSEAIGFSGDPFLNLVAAAQTQLPLPELAACLRELEYAHGRPRNATRFSARQLDIDILTYDDMVGEFDGVILPRPEILESAFVLRPLAELLPGEQHPVQKRTYAMLWEELGTTMTAARRVNFSWRGRVISVAG